MNRETLNFVIGLSGSSARKQPEFNIFINDSHIMSSTLTKAPKEIEYFDFNHEVDEGECSLVIELKNKTNFDTILDANGTIVEDLLLNIESIKIDDIDLGSLLWTASKYIPNYPLKYSLSMKEQGKELPEFITDCVNLGWNGKYIFKFQIPFYIWLLENI